MSTQCGCCWPRDDVAWVPYGNHLWVKMAEYDRLRATLDEAGDGGGVALTPAHGGHDQRGRMIEYDDWVERLDLHARVKVEQMNARIGDLEADCRAANTKVECYRAEIERLRHSQDPPAPDDAVRAAAEYLLRRHRQEDGLTLCQRCSGLWPCEAVLVARAALARGAAAPAEAEDGGDR